MIRTAALVAILAAGCGGAAGKIDEHLAPSATTTPQPRGTNMDIVFQDLSDPSWRHAAEAALGNVNSRLHEWHSARVVIRPWRSDDGAVVPYMLHVEATQTDGRLGFVTPVLVWGDQVGNGGGVAAATGFLASVGFPATRISLGHLLEVLYVTDVVNGTWLEPPSRHFDGWKGVGKPSPATGMAPSLEYTADGAVLHLYRTETVGDRGEPRTPRPGDPAPDPAWRGKHYNPPGPPAAPLPAYGAPGSPEAALRTPYPPAAPHGAPASSEAAQRTPYPFSPPAAPYGAPGSAEAAQRAPYGAPGATPGGMPYDGPSGSSSGASPSNAGMPVGGGVVGGVRVTRPERLDVTFDRRAGVTLTVLRLDPNTSIWQPADNR